MKLRLLIVLLCIMVGPVVSTSTAAIYQYTDTNSFVTEYSGADNYTMPYDQILLASSGLHWLSHGQYFNWGLDDTSSIHTVTQMDIVFHNIFDTALDGNNILNIYLYDNEELGWDADYDLQSAVLPDWSYATHIGAWTYVGTGYDDRMDVQFSITAPELIALIQNGGTFGIGIDPDCAYRVEDITVSVSVPEPATALLFGMGIIGLAAFSRSRIKK